MNEATHTTLVNSLHLPLPSHLKLYHAFENVDRGDYFTAAVRDAVPNSTFYANKPLKFGSEHQSAPFIYAKALSALEIEGLKPLHFLNVGSGTGYMQALVANALPHGSVLHGIELNPELVGQSNERFKQLNPEQKAEMSSFFVGNVFDIDVERNILYDRIYVGAGLQNKNGSCVESFFLSMLKPGGIVVAPVDSYLVKQVKAAVQDDRIGALLRPPVSSSSILHHVRFNEIRSNDDCVDAHEGTPTRLVLQCAVWEARHHIHTTYSAEFQRAVMYLHLVYSCGYARRGRNTRPPPAPIIRSNRLACVEERPAIERVPVELWREIIQFCSRSWFVVPADEIQMLKKLLAEETAKRRVAEEALTQMTTAEQAARQQCRVLQGQLSLHDPEHQHHFQHHFQHQHGGNHAIMSEDEEEEEEGEDEENGDQHGNYDGDGNHGDGDGDGGEESSDDDSSDGDGGNSHFDGYCTNDTAVLLQAGYGNDENYLGSVENIAEGNVYPEEEEEEEEEGDDEEGDDEEGDDEEGIVE